MSNGVSQDGLALLTDPQRYEDAVAALQAGNLLEAAQIMQGDLIGDHITTTAEQEIAQARADGEARHNSRTW